MEKPEKKRLSSPGLKRWLNILFRTGHTGVASVLFGGTILKVQPAQLTVWHQLTIIGGMALLVLEWRHNQSWPHRGMALLVYAHILFVALIHLLPELSIPLLWAVLISGSVGSHMPRKYRHWSILYGPEKKT